MEVNLLNKRMTDTLEILNQLLGHAENPYLLFNADQSSLLCIYLIHKYVSRTVPVLFIDTKQHFEEVYLFLKKLKKLWGIDIVERIRPNEQNEQPTKPSKQECCKLRKVQVIEGAIRDLRIDVLVTGMRKETLRSYKRQEIEENQINTIIVNPLDDWSDDEVHNAVSELNLPKCSLWDLGLYMPDCKPCTKILKTNGDENDSQSDRQEVIRKLSSLGYC
jgi:3'-phosphoadenosine 5'-phosphosulfate sulfotransferase (PAPS reductase)/FAD synthetase